MCWFGRTDSIPAVWLKQHLPEGYFTRHQTGESAVITSALSLEGHMSPIQPTFTHKYLFGWQQVRRDEFNLWLSDTEFCVPNAMKAESRHMGVTAHKDKGANSGEKPSIQFIDASQPPAAIIGDGLVCVKDGGEGVGRRKGTHQGEDALGGSDFPGGARRVPRSMKVLHLLLVPVQNEHHGATGPDNEHREHDFWEHTQHHV